MSTSVSKHVRFLRLIPDSAWGEFETIDRQKTEHARGKSQLEFEQYSEVLANVALLTPGPFTVGVFGDWGTGKTSLMKRVQWRIETLDGVDKPVGRDVITVWFNAWQFEREGNPIVPLIATISKALEDESGVLRKGADALSRALRAVAYGFSLKAKLNAGGVEIEPAFSAKDMIDRAGKLSDPLLERSLYYDAFDILSKATKKGDGPLIVVFIDDLDRCLLDKALLMLEYIKLVMAQPGFVFFLGLDRRIIEAYLEKRFKKDYEVDNFTGREYLDKLFQLSFPIPPHSSRIPDFVKHVIDTHVAEELRSSLSAHVDTIARASCGNPRAVIRLINNLIVDHSIDKADPSEEFGLDVLLHSRVLQERREWDRAFKILTSEEFIGAEFIKIMKSRLGKTPKGVSND